MSKDFGDLVRRLFGRVRFPEPDRTKTPEEVDTDMQEARVAHAAGIAAHDAVLMEFRRIEGRRPK